MATDRHLGRDRPAFKVEGDPDKFIELLKRHGMLARLLRARRCACISLTGSPRMACTACGGEGEIYDYQRKLLQSDEDSDVRGDRNVVRPFRVPILEPISVERLLPEEQGGIKKYGITSFDSNNIFIEGSPLPFHFHKMRVSYYFDRYDRVLSDPVEVNINTKVLTTTLTLFDGQHTIGNVDAAHGDLTLVTRVYDSQLDHTFTDFTFRKNQIILATGEPVPTPGFVEVDYFFAPPAPVLPSDIETMREKATWTHVLESGTVRMSMEPWYELSEGDLVTFLTSDFYRDEVIEHNSTGIDNLAEFDIFRVEDEIYDEDGGRFRKGIDFDLRPFRSLVWLATGTQPNAGKRISVRYGYRPTFRIWRDNPTPNNLENKKYPKTFMGKRYMRARDKDVGLAKNVEYAPDTGSDKSSSVGGFTNL